MTAMTLTLSTKRMPETCSPVQYIRRFFDRHPEVCREQLLLEAVCREIARREQSRPEGGKCRRLTPEDVRLHGWISERLEVVRRERDCGWRKVLRLLTGN